MEITNVQQNSFLFVSVYVKTNTVSATAVRCHVMLDTGGNFHFVPSFNPQEKEQVSPDGRWKRMVILNETILVN
jgi:hypothetical protein